MPKNIETLTKSRSNYFYWWLIKYVCFLGETPLQLIIDSSAPSQREKNNKNICNMTKTGFHYTFPFLFRPNLLCITWRVPHTGTNLSGKLLSLPNNKQSHIFNHFVSQISEKASKIWTTHFFIWRWVCCFYFKNK